MSYRARVKRIQKIFDTYGLDAQTLKQKQEEQEFRRLMREYFERFGIQSPGDFVKMFIEDGIAIENFTMSDCIGCYRRRLDKAEAGSDPLANGMKSTL